MLTFIRYIEVYFAIALLDCVRYEDFVKPTFCSIHFIAILAGLKNAGSGPPFQTLLHDLN